MENISEKERGNVGEKGSDCTPQSGVVRGALTLTLTLLLFQACASGDVVAVTNLVSERNANPFSKDESGRTPLGVACEAGHVQVARYLIEKEGVSPGFRGTDGATPLHSAARGGHLTVVRYLVDEQGVDPSSRDRNQLTPLDYAKNDDVKNFLASRGAKGSQQKKFQPVTLPKATLLLSKQQSQPKPELLRQPSLVLPNGEMSTGNKAPVLDMMISGVFPGQDLEQQTSESLAKAKPSEGAISLFNASEKGDLDCVKKILEEQSLDPNICRDKNRKSVVHLACSHGHLELVKYLADERHCDLESADKDKNTPLHLAALGGHLSVVQYLINEKGCNPMDKGDKGMTALHFACKADSYDTVKFLVEVAKVDVSSCRDDNGTTPLHIAVQFASLKAVRYLVEEQKCDVECRNNYELTPLHCAAARGKLDTVQYLIDEHKCDPSCQGRMGVTPLYCASESGCLAVVKYLIEDKKVDSARRFQNETTLLHMAAQFGTLEVVKYLVEEQNFDINCKNTFGNTPFLHAVGGEKIDIMKYLADERSCDPTFACINGLTALHVASRLGNLEIVKYLVEEQKLDVSSKEETGMTSLHCAVLSGKLPVVKYLVKERHCDVEGKDVLGNSPLLFALHTRQLDIVQYLVVESGCDPMTIGMNGWNAIHFVAKQGGLDIMKYLVESGKVDASCKDGNGSTPLHIAAQFGTLEMVKYLMEEQHCDPEVRNVLGNTALHHAAVGGNLETLKYLICEKRCDPMIRGQNNFNVLHYATLSGRVDMIKFLLDNTKMDPLSPDGMGATPLHIATFHGHFLVVKLLIEEYQCDPRIRNGMGFTTGDIARTRGHYQIMMYLSIIEDMSSTQLRKILETQLKKYIKKAKPTGTVLGNGAYGSVIELSSAGETVAGKLFKVSSSAMQLPIAFKVCGELNMMMQLNHKNIVQCKGVSLLLDHPLPLLLMERMMTSLQAYLLKPDNSDLPVKRKASILLDTASGLEYLHSRTPAIIHRDLTATNVLLDSQLTAKITDFGNSRIIDLDPGTTPETLTSIPGTLEYMPPEAQGEDYDPSLDVFSFGHLSLFTVIQSPVHPLLPPSYTDTNDEQVVVIELHRRKQFIEKAKQVLPEGHSFLKLIEGCLQNRPALRPRSKELVTSLKEILITAAAKQKESKELGTQDLLYVKKVLEPVTVRWKRVGLALRLDPAQLDAVEEKNRKLDDCLTEMLNLWLSKQYDTEQFGEPSWSLLAGAVAHPAGGNNTALGTEIIKVHIGDEEKSVAAQD